MVFQQGLTIEGCVFVEVSRILIRRMNLAIFWLSVEVQLV
jgi:hypothetical protein